MIKFLITGSLIMLFVEIFLLIQWFQISDQVCECMYIFTIQMFICMSLIKNSHCATSTLLNSPKLQLQQITPTKLGNVSIFYPNT